VNFVQTLQGIMGPEATQIYINPKTTPYLLAQDLQIDARHLNSPDQVAEVMQNVQNQHNQQQMMQQAQGTQPAQNPSDQIVQQQ